MKGPLRSTICMIRMVTLAILAGMLLVGTASATTYYVANGGVDTNNGTAKATPWAHAPGMPGCSNGCAAYSHAAGDRIVLKGGDVWQHANLPWVWVGNGASGSPDYLGVDVTWYDGGSFAQPILDSQLSTAGDQAVLDVRNRSYVTIDNLEIKNITSSADSYNYALIYAYNASNITVTNSYLHAWRSTASTDSAKHGGFFGANSATLTNNVVSDVEYADNGDGVSDTTLVGTGFSGNTIHDMPTALEGVAGNISGNTVYDIYYPVPDRDPSEHTSVFYHIQSTGTASIFNNTFYNVAPGTGVYIEPCWASGNGTVYVYNNVYYNGSHSVGGGGLFNANTEGGSGSSCGSVYFYNNTLETSVNACIYLEMKTAPFAHATIQNNHCIFDNGSNIPYIIDSGVAVNLVNANNTNISNAAATAAAYVVSNLFQPSAGSPTVAAGVNLTSAGIAALDVDKLGAARPSSGAWDTGAYQFGGSTNTSSKPAAPSNLAAIVQ